MRRKSRECALQILYQLDTGGDLQGQNAVTLTPVFDEYWQGFGSEKSRKAVDRELTERLVTGVCVCLDELDTCLGNVADRWRIDRMERVDRNLLRLGAYELLYCIDTPRAVVINEAVEIAKGFGSANAGSFVNGLLDKIYPTNENSPSGKEK